MTAKADDLNLKVAGFDQRLQMEKERISQAVKLAEEAKSAAKENSVPWLAIISGGAASMFAIATTAGSLVWFVMDQRVQAAETRLAGMISAVERSAAKDTKTLHGEILSVEKSSARERETLDEKYKDIKERKIREIAELGAKLAEHEEVKGHTGILIQATEIDQRLKVVERAISDDDALQTTVTAEMTKLSGLSERALLLIGTNTEKLNDTTALATSNERSIASAANTMQANLKEVETQIRSTVEKNGETIKWIDRMLSILWADTMDFPLPDFDHTPSQIPARATSALGEVSTNGHSK